MSQCKIHGLVLLAAVMLTGGCSSEEPIEVRELSELQQLLEAREKYPAVAAHLDETTDMLSQATELLRACSGGDANRVIQVEPALRALLRASVERSECLAQAVDHRYILTCIEPQDLDCDEECPSTEAPDKMLECIDRLLACDEATELHYYLESETRPSQARR